jgi:hypothetical protein
MMMKRVQPKKRRLILKKTKRNSNGGESKTIAVLPSTTLKYREDTPEPAETATSHSSGFRSPILSLSLPQKILRASKKSRTIFFAKDEDDEYDEEEDAEPLARLWGCTYQPTEILQLIVGLCTALFSIAMMWVPFGSDS